MSWISVAACLSLTFIGAVTALPSLIRLRLLPQVVQLIKSSPENPTTAAIGDGANDVSMIMEAHVGLGAYHVTWGSRDSAEGESEGWVSEWVESTRVTGYVSEQINE